MASAFLARRCLARMDLALAVHLKGLGFWFRCSIHSSIAILSSMTSLKVPRRMRWRVISAKSRSTRLSQEQDVGVMCGRLAVDCFQKRQELVCPMTRQASADDGTGRHIQRGEECCGAVALVM